MPDLPELYEILDKELDRLNLIDPFAHDDQWKYQLEKSMRVSALCAAIEIKEAHEKRGEWVNTPTSDELFGPQETQTQTTPEEGEPPQEA